MIADTPLRSAAGAFDFGAQEVQAAPETISSIFLTHESLREFPCLSIFGLAAAMPLLFIAGVFRTNTTTYSLCCVYGGGRGLFSVEEEAL